MSSILVVGGSGYLGQSLSHILGQDGVATYHSKPIAGGFFFDASKDRLSAHLSSLPADLSHVIITYGVINPELCARDPERSAHINVSSVIRVLSDAMDADLIPIFLSTDYVFDGTKGSRNETELPCPTTQYGRQKVAVENWLQSTGKHWIIARASKLVSGALNTHSVLGQWVNDIKAGQEMRCASDQIFSPALVDDAAAAILHLANTNSAGIFHVAGEQALSRFALAETLVNAVHRVAPDLSINLKRAKLADFPFLETRPLNTSLSTEKLRALSPPPFRSMESLCAEIARINFS
ncbi:MAG: sugar nucleotide-binding protein [Parvibaculum sp.]|nr:sugar nucleotide-binding protein [Parvibaculum sp.]